ncbi:UNVERIFIED_CONTAM: hypothetical protein FKN15_065616 [Acipenser sinensis]
MGKMSSSPFPDFHSLKSEIANLEAAEQVVATPITWPMPALLLGLATKHPYLGPYQPILNYITVQVQLSQSRENGKCTEQHWEEKGRADITGNPVTGMAVP